LKLQGERLKLDGKIHRSAMAQQPESIPQTPAPTSSRINGDGGTAPAKPTSQSENLFYASVWPGLDNPLPRGCEPLAKAILEFEKITDCQAWLILQSDTESKPLDEIGAELAQVMVDEHAQFESGKNVVVFLHTWGGDADSAYRIATFLQKKAGGFEVVVPKMAKSAGTLLTLGATKIIMGQMAELGPLDMQVRDPESEQMDSALNETKSLQTLSREALVLYAQKMEVLKKLYRWKTFETRNRIATEFVNEMIRPLVKKISAVHYTKMARIMEIMKKYGRGLMTRAGYPISRASKVVEKLGEDFPDHGYIIDTREARELGLRAESAKPEIASIVEIITSFCGGKTIIGKISCSQENGT
jgi:hypothetical protein